jgi:hypothetical protein
VTDRATGMPVPGAVVALPDLEARTVSDRDGLFSFPDSLPASFPYRRIDAVVRAPGWGSWTLRGAPLYPNDELRLNVELREQDWEHRVATRDERSLRAGPSSSRHTGTCTGWRMQLAPPRTIKVFISDEGVAREYDFLFYVTHVLPNEWIPSWDADALAAGAIAVKTYGAYRTMPEHAYSGGKGCADVIDTAQDQVFDPSWSTASTDQAVFESYGSILWRDGGWFLSQYYAGSPGDPCSPVTGTYEGRMSQWGTQTCATEGMAWPDIVTTFYEGTKWHYLQNLLLNPAVENNVIYPWQLSKTAELKRVKFGAYEGVYYYQLSTSSPPTAGITYQLRPYQGTPTTQYRLRVALRCDQENDKDCIIKLRVIARAEDGSSVLRQKKVTEPRDGLWRVYTLGPRTSEIVHSNVEAQFLSVQTIGIDDAELKIEA